jgi:hypothetical protein
MSAMTPVTRKVTCGDPSRDDDSCSRAFDAGFAVLVVLMILRVATGDLEREREVVRRVLLLALLLLLLLLLVRRRFAGEGERERERLAKALRLTGDEERDLEGDWDLETERERDLDSERIGERLTCFRSTDLDPERDGDTERRLLLRTGEALLERDFDLAPRSRERERDGERVTALRLFGNGLLLRLGLLSARRPRLTLRLRDWRGEALRGLLDRLRLSRRRLSSRLRGVIRSELNVRQLITQK